jgi:Tfp pilus assembly ATPase PilU
MNEGELEGMQTFDGVLEKFIREGVVRKEIGLAYASNQNNLRLAISDLP